MYEYWTGEGINIEKVWGDYESGKGYIEKYHQIQNRFILKIEFEAKSFEPLFNHEAIYKSFKWLYHEIKKNVFDDNTYNKSGPIYLNEINRGSSVWIWIGEHWPILILILLLAGKADDWITSKIENHQQIEINKLNIKKLKIELNNKTNTGIGSVIEKLRQQGIVKISMKSEHSEEWIVELDNRK